MLHKNNIRKALPILSVLLMVLFNQPMKAHAFVDLHRERGHVVEKPRDKGKGDDHGHDLVKPDEHHDEHQDEHHDEHHE